MTIVFYAARMSSATPVASALNELGVPHERVEMDLARGDQRSPEHLARNPNGKVPTLVVDGTPMFEALAIMQWLGDRYGVESGLWPAADAAARLTALSWTTWAYVTYGAAIYRANLASSERAPAELKSEAHAAQARRDLSDLLGILDGWLAARAWVLGESFSLADLIVGSVVAYGTYCGAPVDDHPRVKDWLARVSARPSMRAEWS
ncbi:MAG: glutathione S-transferase family protein [Sandaracinaceae bacterium]|nr:glutathione S-transferase family protein [Sandaracinaceae bacterium]